MSGTITHSWNGTVLTITSDSGTSSADLKGDIGIRGPQGAPGVVLGSVTSINGLDGDIILTAEDIGAVTEAELENYYNKEEINLAITNYYTKEEIENNTEQVVAEVMSAIPSTVSDLENDAGYQTAADVLAVVNEQLGVIENGTY